MAPALLQKPWALFPFLPSSAIWKECSLPWLHPQEQQDAGYTQDWISHLVDPYPWAELAPLTSQSWLCPRSLLFLLCQTLWFLVCGPQHALAKVLITVHLSSSCLLASALPALILLFFPDQQHLGAPPHPDMHPCTLNNCSNSTELKQITHKWEIFSKLFFKTQYLRGQLCWDLQAGILWAWGLSVAGNLCPLSCALLMGAH